MNRSPNFNRGGGYNRFYGGTPNRHNHQGVKQPLYLHPNSPNLTPRENFNNRKSDDKAQSPDFIPIAYSSPMRAFPNNSWNQDRSNNSWNQDRSNNSWNNSQNRNRSFGSTSSSPRSSASSSPYNKFGRKRGGFNNSNNSNNYMPIEHYCDKSMLEDPWAECEQELMKYDADKSKTEEMSSESDESSEKEESVSNEES